ncbi:hypothetical protein ACFOTA_15430 [Chitinophaga sp. GCM10012297]|uniref:Uncharacterized protein n=1 Tax=Chitinophaga chungangae TaxID=2821488 RepID=A0ABS3YG05_9BACT|nr:hypothetical protein [Chitinophaga chungangae]MBO9153612.1 hypothetical protein [Chitinophaga chungangae]
MKMRFITGLALLFSTTGFAQNGFKTGTATVHIDPDTNAVYSAALAGYGVPREGRFSLTWQPVQPLADITALTSANGRLYAATSRGEWITAAPAADTFQWKAAGKTPVLKALTAMNGKFYAADAAGEIFEGAPCKTGVRWKKRGNAGPVTALAYLNGKLYASVGNTLTEGTITAGKISWRTLDNAPAFISMTSNGRELYGANSGDSLWTGVPGPKGVTWRQIGRKNDITYKVAVRQMAVLGHVLYAADDANVLHKGSHKTMNNLTARALAISRNGKTAVIVGIDVCGFNATLGTAVKEAVSKSRNIPPSAILLNASHTHFAPVTQTWITWGDFYHFPDSNYLNKVVKPGIVRAIEEAVDNLSPSNLYFGRGFTNIGHNRRAGANAEKPYDNVVDVLKVTDAQDKLKNVLFLTGCHPVFKNADEESFTLSANYPAVARKLVEERTGSDNAVFIQGCGGDINPRSADHRETGAELAADVIHVLDAGLQRIEGDISFFMDTVNIPVQPWSVDSIVRFRTANEGKPGDVEAEKNVRWANLMLQRYKNNTVENILPEYVQTINIGDWKFVGISREAVTEYGKGIRGIWPGKRVSVAAYCNDVASYLPVAWHIRAGVYEGFGSFLWYGQPGIPPLDVYERLIESIRAKNR